MVTLSRPIPVNLDSIASDALGKSKPLGFLTVRIGRLRKDYWLQEKAEFPRFLERLGCGSRVSKVVLCGMTFNTSGTLFIESILKNKVFKSMELVVCHELDELKSVCQHHRLPEFVRKHTSKITALTLPGELLTSRDVHLPALPHVSTIGRVAKPFEIDDETFLRMVDAQHNVLTLKSLKVELTEHGLLAAFLAIADNPQPQYVEITVELMTAIKFMYLFGSELTWDGFMPSNHDDFHVFAKRCRKKGRTESLLVTIVNHRRSYIFLQTPSSQMLTATTEEDATSAESPPSAHKCSPMMSIDAWPLELQEQVLFFVDLPDRLNVRACCSALKNAVAASNLAIFHPVTSELDNLVFQGMENNDLMIHLGSKMVMNASTIPLSDNVLKMRSFLGKRIRVNYLVLRKLYFNVAVLSFITRMLINVDFRTLRIEMVNKGEWSRGLGAFINQYADRMDLHIPSLLQEELHHLKPLARVQIYVSREGLMGNRIFWSLAEDDFREIVGQRHAYLKTPKGVSWGETMRDVMEKLGNSPCDQVVEFEACDRAVRGLFKLLGFSKPNKKRGFAQPSGQRESRTDLRNVSETFILRYTVENHLERKRWTNECTIFYKKAALHVTYNRNGAEYQTVRGTNHSTHEKDA
ncbi:hypothetical protein PRIPAC_78657 [Pristionchus pacificus]|uniref:Uncharacterized protein n=1 Tax=Pristionchus pacificus TaxID=54126 RepID=A0A2A6CKN2_PRIPA|nr:hypothetical protein PRIPAC_78657 [Pristionchus pacificus]|eukprot:PDM78785.1 hypothetical protein PRIPAC_31364 [Pristionchus pacificus]